ncbi:MAG: RtcB family protein [Bacteroidota bacterium]
MAKIKKKHLLRIGFEDQEAIKLALAAMMHDKLIKKGRQAKLGLLQSVLQNPERFYKHEILSEVAKSLQPEEADPNGPDYPDLNETALPYKIYGEAGIEAGALKQMEIAARLPVAKAAALMPDAHQGYGLPIGGVLATQNAIIPYAVGVDIGCRMCLTVYDLKEAHLTRYKHSLKEALMEHTYFGAGKGPDTPMDDEVLDRELFREIAILKHLHGKAVKQIGSSGGGNHFVEYGLVKIMDPDNEWNVPPKTYLGILSHSGSRGLGAGVANYYTKLAMDKNRLPREAKQLAWLDMDSEAGQEYWLAMNLAGEYASACHHHIHHRLSKAMGEKPMFMVENHHNFAWKETLEDGTKVIVHRKGATPAGKGVLGIIPGSMTAPGYIVRGKGAARSINSASHGAGRLMSRTKAKNSLTHHYVKKYLREHQLTLMGGGLDEAPMAYKNIDEVMAYQRDLVDVIGSFTPKIVRMAKD